MTDRSTVLFGHKGRSLVEVSNMAIESLALHAGSGARLEDWIPPFATVSLGKLRTMGADSLEEIVVDASRRYAHYSAIQQKRSVEPLTRWLNEIKRLSLESKKHWEPYFSRKFTLKNGARPTVMDFAGQSAAFAFAVLDKRENLANQVQTSKAKMINLLLLRDYVSRVPISDFWPTKQTHFELLLRIPPKEHHNYEESVSVLHELEDLADKENIRVEAVESAESAEARMLMFEH